MHSDHPTLNDKLNRLNLIQAKALQVIDCDPPQTLGIHGDWGSGKTSFLRQLRFHLDGMHDGCEDAANSNITAATYDKKVVSIWFDAWRYQHEAAPIIALLHEIRRQYGTWDKIKNSGEKLGTVACRSILNSFSDITKLLKLETLPINAKDIQKQGETWKKQHLETRLGTDTVQDFLQEAITSLIGEDRRLVIFIDDLDRCSSTAAYRLLEGLKVYLNLNNCVFVIGMNQKIVVDAIAKELTLYDNQNNESLVRIYAEAYLEKLCSSIERLTPPIDCEKLLIDWIVDTNHRQNLTTAICGDDGEFIRCLPPNPRRIKALANVLNQWLTMPNIPDLTSQNEAIRSVGYQCLVVLAYVYQFHSEIFQRWQFTPDFFDTLNRWAIDPWSAANAAEGPKQPSYLQCLELPHTTKEAQQGDTADYQLSSNFPDPYAVNIFWVQPLMFYAQLQVGVISPIMAAVTAFNNDPTQ